MEYVYSYKKHNYKVLINDIEVGSFSEINAGDITADQLGLLKYGSMTLKRGLTTAPELIVWLQRTVAGICERKTITIQLCDDEQETIAEWEIINVLPTKCTPLDSNATSNEVVIESVELAYEGIIRIKP